MLDVGNVGALFQYCSQTSAYSHACVCRPSILCVEGSGPIYGDPFQGVFHMRGMGLFISLTTYNSEFHFIIVP